MFRQMHCYLLIFFLLICISFSSHADVVKPALVEISVNTNGSFSIEVRASIEALLTGINSRYKNTKDAPNAQAYDELRALSKEQLLASFQKFEKQFYQQIKLSFDQQPTAFKITAVKIPEPGYVKVPRISVISLTGEAPVTAKSLSWYYPMSFGDNAVRVRQIDETNEKWHWSAWQWLREDKASQPFSLTEVFTQQSLSEIISTYLVSGFEHILPKGLDHILFILGIFLLIVAAVVLVTEGTRKIPVQYAKRVIGRKVYGGQTTYIPIRVSGFGVMAIIFAQALMFLPQTVKQFFPNNEVISNILSYFDLGSPLYWMLFGILILFFTYFYAAIAFNPLDVAENMRKQGGFVPGVRPGKKTAEYIDHVLSRIMLPAAAFFAVVAIFPYFVRKYFNVTTSFSGFFGGTSLLIMVGVALDTLQQIESHLLMRHYDGFMKTGKIRGRR